MRHILCSILLTVTTTVSHAAGIEISDAWVAEAPPVSRVHAGYLELENDSKDVITLTGVTTDAYGKVEIHRSIEQDGVASMQRIDSLVIDADESISFEPGGYHLMLFRPAQRWKQGDRFDLTLQFEGGHSVTTGFEVRKMQAAGEHHHHHHH